MKRSYFKRIMASIIIICIVFGFTSISTVKAADNSDATVVGNDYPIVMVHGCFGWGRNEGAGLYYWGGKESLTQSLPRRVILYILHLSDLFQVTGIGHVSCIHIL